MKRPIKEGDTLTISGCAWSAGWEFDCPIVLYRGIRAYSPNRSGICEDSIEGFIEDQLIDVVVDGYAKTAWTEGELREFKWRRWSPAGFKKRRGAVHCTVVATFHRDEYGNLSFTTQRSPA